MYPLSLDARSFVDGQRVRLMASVFDALKEINQEGTTILLVEQYARLALLFSGRGYVLVSGRDYVLENGSLVLEGNSSDLLADPAVKRTYLGG